MDFIITLIGTEFRHTFTYFQKMVAQKYLSEKRCFRKKGIEVWAFDGQRQYGSYLSSAFNDKQMRLFITYID